MTDHPPPEKLAAYHAGEMPSEEADAIQEHVANCGICAEALLDLQRFLDPPPAEQPQRGVADFETAAEWRRLRRKVQPRLGRFFRSPGVSVAAVLAVTLIGALYRLALVEKELAEPITDLRPTTFESPGSRKGESSTPEPTSFRLGHVAAFETLSNDPYPRFRLIFRDEEGRIRRVVEDTEDTDGMITLFLPKRFLAPGHYRVEVVGVDGSVAHSVRSFEVRLLR